MSYNSLFHSGKHALVLSLSHDYQAFRHSSQVQTVHTKLSEGTAYSRKSGNFIMLKCTAHANRTNSRLAALVMT